MYFRVNGIIMRFIASILFFLIGAVPNGLTQTCNCPEMDKYYKSNDFDSTTSHQNINLWKKSKQLRKSKKPACQSFGYQLLAEAQLKELQLKEALISLDRQKQLLDSLNCEKSAYVYWYIVKANYFIRNGNYAEAEVHLLRADMLQTKLKNPVLKATIQLNLTQVYSKHNKFDEVEEIVKKYHPQVVLFTDNEKKVDLLNQLGQRYIYLFKKNNITSYLDSASNCANYAKSLSQRMNYIEGWVKSFDVLEDKFYFQENYRQAAVCLDSALVVSNPIAHWRLRAPIFENLADLYLEQKKYSKAYQYADSNLFYAQKSTNLHLVKNALDLLYNCAKLSGNFERAIETFNTVDELKDSLARVENTEALSALEEKYHKVRKNNSISDLIQDRRLLEKQREISGLKRKLITVGIIIFSLLAAYIFIVWRQKAIKQSKNDLQLKMRLDKARINPDFINDALEDLQNTSANPKQIEEKIFAFSKLLKRTQESTSNDFMTLDKEIKFLETYLELQQSTKKQKFNHHFHVDDQLMLNDVCVPTMILQPFLESTIQDGFKDLNYNGEINLYFNQSKPGELSIKIQDNGKGLKAIDGSRASEIINDRFYLLNHMQRGFASYLVRERLSGGVSVEIFIPLITKEMADQLKQQEI